MVVAGGHTKKRQRVGSTSRFLSNISAMGETLTTASQRRRLAALPPQTLPFSSSSAASHGVFNDPATADVVLLLRPEPSPFDFETDSDSITAAVEGGIGSDDDDAAADEKIYIHSAVLRRSKYFAALLSDLWRRPHGGVDSDKIQRLSIGVSAASGSIEQYLEVLHLLYVDNISGEIKSASEALEILPVALELLFEDCIRACIRFLEAVPWSEDEEKKVLSMIPFLREEESRELLHRILPESNEIYEEMLHGLIIAATHNHPNVAVVKAFVAKLLREFSSRESAGRVLDRAFEVSLKVVKESLEEYSSPDFRGDHNETEAIQRLNLHTAMTNGRHLLWLVERMIELKVADRALKEWSEQASFTSDLQRAFRDDAWRNIVPGLPVVVLRSTCKLANAVTAGTILAPRQVRMKLVKDWLPVLNVCRDNVSPMLPNHKPLYLELEEAFLRIISTLPVSDAQELLQQCLSFATRNVEECPHLVAAFNTWFRRAMWAPQLDDLR